MKYEPRFEKTLLPTPAFSIASPHSFPVALQPLHSRPLAHTSKNIGGVPPKSESQAKVSNDRSEVASFDAVIEYRALQKRGTAAPYPYGDAMTRWVIGLVVIAMAAGAGSGQTAGTRVTAQGVVDAIKGHVGVEWREKTVV